MELSEVDLEAMAHEMLLPLHLAGREEKIGNRGSTVYFRPQEWKVWSRREGFFDHLAIEAGGPRTAPDNTGFDVAGCLWRLEL